MDFNTHYRAGNDLNNVEDEYMDLEMDYDMVPIENIQGMAPMMNPPCMQGMMGMPQGYPMMPQAMQNIMPQGMMPEMVNNPMNVAGMMNNPMNTAGMMPQSMQNVMPQGVMPEMMNNPMNVAPMVNNPMEVAEIMEENMHGMNMMYMEEENDAMEDDLKDKTRSRNFDANDVNKIVARIERYNPGIFASLRRCGFSYAVARNYIRRIVRLSLMYYED